ncbi:MAG TPA: glycosyltransferase, partial [Fimbriimonadaceae bacterium]|nr:glycosyltransferase [Fimbriimonadaceae bacterium]
MRILLLSDMFPPDSDGGQEVNAEKIAKGLRQRGHDLDVVTAVFRQGYSGGRETRDWVNRILEHQPQHYPARSAVEKIQSITRYLKENRVHFSNLRKLRTFLQDRTCDVMYVFGASRVGYIPTLAATEMGIPILWHQGGNNIENRLLQAEQMGRIPRLIRARLCEEEKLDLRHIAYVSQFLVNESEAKGIVGKKGRGSGATVVIPRGIEYEPRKDVDRERENPPVFLMAGRIAYFK